MASVNGKCLNDKKRLARVCTPVGSPRGKEKFLTMGSVQVVSILANLGNIYFFRYNVSFVPNARISSGFQKYNFYPTSFRLL